MTINNADILTNLEGLENLASYTSLDIINNYGLTTLRHLSSNYPLLGLTVRSVYISNNIHLQDIDGLQHIANVTGKNIYGFYPYHVVQHMLVDVGTFQVSFNSMLRSLDGLNNTIEVNDLVIFNLPLINELNIANNLWKANSITIFRNTVSAYCTYIGLMAIHIMTS